ncbi:hypothetical protein Q3G72_012846 [Acer saccharum]|nr:hypothetical protein Q3G72_012846 [Acer saccharum]
MASVEHGGDQSRNSIPTNDVKVQQINLVPDDGGNSKGSYRSPMWKHFEKKIVCGEEKTKCNYCKKFRFEEASHFNDSFNTQMEVTHADEDANADPLMNFDLFLSNTTTIDHGGGHSCFSDSDEARIRARRKKFWEKAVDVQELCGPGETWWGVRGEMRDNFNYSNTPISYAEHFQNSRFVESILDVYWEIPPVAGPTLTHQTRYDPARAPSPTVEDGRYSLFQRLSLSQEAMPSPIVKNT